MQQRPKTIYRKCLIGIMGTIWISGLVIAGSDGPLMPWVNIAGLVLFLGATVFLGRVFNSRPFTTRIITCPKFHSRPVVMPASCLTTVKSIFN